MNNKVDINLNKKNILVTGSSGFIGANLVLRLLTDKTLLNTGTIVSVDSMNNYYDVKLKKYRLDLINRVSKDNSVKHYFYNHSINDKEFMLSLFNNYKFDIVINLAAQAGVRYSIVNPDAYIESNIIGFYNIIESCRNYSDNVKHLVFASSSSVYGNNKKIPFSVDDKVDEPVSLYAATKKTDELLAYCYSKLYNIPCTGLRFFTVYGPAGRPDMFYYSATEKLIKHEKITVFNHGNMKRDFTYIDDIVEGLIRVIKKAPAYSCEDDRKCNAPYSIYNIGGGEPINLMLFLSILNKELINNNLLPINFDINKYIEFVDMQLGDVPITYADTSSFLRDFDYKPIFDINYGLEKFVKWYKEYMIL